MSNSEDKAKDFALNTITGSSTVLAGVLAEKFIPGSGPVLPALAVLFDSTLTLAIRGFFERRAEPFSQGYASEFSSAEAARAHGEQHKNSEAYQTTMYQSFRAMMDAVDSSVVPTLGRLTAQYNRAEAMPDTYFRSVARLLCDLEPGDLDQLLQLLRTLRDGDIGHGYVTIHITNEGNVGVRNKVTKLVHVPAAWKLVNVLRREHFTLESVIHRHGDDVAFHTETVTGLLATLDPQVRSP